MPRPKSQRSPGARISTNRRLRITRIRSLSPTKTRRSILRSPPRTYDLQNCEIPRPDSTAAQRALPRADLAAPQMPAKHGSQFQGKRRAVGLEPVHAEPTGVSFAKAAGARPGSLGYAVVTQLG